MTKTEWLVMVAMVTVMVLGGLAGYSIGYDRSNYAWTNAHKSHPVEVLECFRPEATGGRKLNLDRGETDLYDCYRPFPFKTWPGGWPPATTDYPGSPRTLH